MLFCASLPHFRLFFSVYVSLTRYSHLCSACPNNVSVSLLFSSFTHLAFSKKVRPYEPGLAQGFLTLKGEFFLCTCVAELFFPPEESFCFFSNLPLFLYLISNNITNSYICLGVMLKVQRDYFYCNGRYTNKNELDFMFP